MAIGNNSYSRNKNPTDSSVTSFRTDISSTQLKFSMPDFHSKDNEASPSSIGGEASLVPTEVDYINKIDTKSTTD